MEAFSSSWSTHQAWKMLGSRSHRLWQPGAGMACPVLPFEFQIPTPGSRGYPIFYNVSPRELGCLDDCCLPVLYLHSGYDAIIPGSWPERAYLSSWFILWSPEKYEMISISAIQNNSSISSAHKSMTQFLQREGLFLQSPSKGVSIGNLGLLL